MAYNTPQFRERLRAHCSESDLERWKVAARASGARNFSEWVRWVLDKESALQSAAARNPWVDRKSGVAKQREIPLTVGNGLGRKQKEFRPTVGALVDEAEGL